MKLSRKLVIAVVLALSFGPLSFIAQPARAQLSLIRTIVFPVIGTVHYSDDFGAPRSGHTHEGNDLLGAKLMPLVAAVDGTVSFVVYPEATYGYMVSIRDSDGWKYNYLHINNDHPGTDDDQGGGIFAYAPGIEDGAKVVKGQLVGWMGDSGNAESTSPHLHFEIRAPDDTAISPYQSLQAAPHLTVPTPPAPQATEFWPYGDFSGGASLATGNLNADPNQELVIGAGAGGGPLVRTFVVTSNSSSISATPLSAFYAYDPSFRGGVDVAVGDVNGDGVDEIITAAGTGGGPHIRIFKADGTPLPGFPGFFAYAPSFHGGVHVAIADLNGDHKAEIITGAGAGGGPHVRVFNPDGTMLREFFAYDPNFHGGIDVAATATVGSQVAAIVTAAGKDGGPHVKVFSAAGVEQASFYAYDPAFHGGVRVNIGAIGSGSAPQIITAPASGGGTDFKAFNFTGTAATGYTAFESWWSGGFDAAVLNGALMVATGPTPQSGPASRRVTVQQAASGNSNQNNFNNRNNFNNNPSRFQN